MIMMMMIMAMIKNKFATK